MPTLCCTLTASFVAAALGRGSLCLVLSPSLPSLSSLHLRAIPELRERREQRPRESERESVRSLGCISRLSHTHTPEPHPRRALLFLTILGSGPKTLKPQSIQAPPDLSPESIYLCTSRDACHDPFLISPARLEIRLSERAVSNPVVPARTRNDIIENCLQSLPPASSFFPVSLLS